MDTEYLLFGRKRSTKLSKRYLKGLALGLVVGLVGLATIYNRPEATESLYSLDSGAIS